jgi:HSP20 family molecular chaperone IbpA
MAFFPRLAAGEFAPLFRLLDDYDVHRSASSGISSIRAFTPRFDVKEAKDAYHLDGELPGIKQKDIQIEFTDPHTLVIKGRSKREYTASSVSDSDSDGNASSRAQIEGANESHQPTVEDEDAQPVTTVARTSAEGQVAKPTASHKYWISERSVGEFQRAFTFPTRVNQDEVKASLKDGILSIVVPKAATPTSKKITIE